MEKRSQIRNDESRLPEPDALSGGWLSMPRFSRSMGTTTSARRSTMHGSVPLAKGGNAGKANNQFGL